MLTKNYRGGFKKWEQDHIEYHTGNVPYDVDVQSLGGKIDMGNICKVNKRVYVS